MWPVMMVVVLALVFGGFGWCIKKSMEAEERKAFKRSK